MPQYAAIIYDRDVDWTLPEYAEETKEYGEFGEAAAAVLRGGAALYPTSTATTVQVQGGKGGDVVTSDGPYTETKEALTGFYLVEAADLDEAVGLAAKIPAAWHGGTVEVRPVIDFGMWTTDAAQVALSLLVRDEGARVVATLVRLTGDVQLAEDAVQDAAIRALQSWPTDGVPDSPRAWLTVVARRRALDIVRREGGRDVKEAEAVRLQSLFADEPPEHDVPDDLLRLVFTCCHPTLALETQVALSLRTLCGLSTAEVARALLVPEATMNKRLTRARQKIAKAGIPFRIPPAAELPDRVRGVAAVVYLLFNEGYAATAGEEPIRPALVDEALRLGRLLHGLMPDEPALTGLLALMLLQDSRRQARLGPGGELVLLPDQDRRCWDRDKIYDGVRLVGEGLARTPGRPDPYVVQAALAACHALAPAYADTDWNAVVEWYDVLLTVQDTPVTRLNRAAALAERDGPESGLAGVDAVRQLENYALWHATRAVLLDRLGRGGEAASARERALALDANAAVRRHLQGD